MHGYTVCKRNVKQFSSDLRSVLKISRCNQDWKSCSYRSCVSFLSPLVFSDTRAVRCGLARSHSMNWELINPWALRSSLTHRTHQMTRWLHISVITIKTKRPTPWDKWQVCRKAIVLAPVQSVRSLWLGIDRVAGCGSAFRAGDDLYISRHINMRSE